MCDLEIAGLRLKQGQQVGLMLGAANRDPDALIDPERLDGMHFCLGAPMALEAQVFSALTGRFPSMQLAAEGPTRRETVNLRGLAALPVVW